MSERNKRWGIRNTSGNYGKYSIKDVEKICGIKAHTIRIWEQRYGIIKPDRTDTNIRYYSNEELKKLLNISLLLRNGSKISHLSRLNSEELARRIAELEKISKSKDTFFDFNIDQLITAMIDFEESKVHSILDESIQSFGMEETMMELLIPFLYKVGILWRTGEINVMQEHFTTQILRQKILCATEQLPRVNAPIGESYLLFLPANEIHEIGLIFSSYLIRKAGKRVIYAGQSLPVEEAVLFSNRYIPSHVLLFFSAGYSRNAQRSYIQTLANEIQFSKILVAKPFPDEENDIPFPNVEYLYQFAQLKNLLA